MKLSELSFREYIALECFPAIVAGEKYKSPNEAAWLAFGHADAFLKRAGREQDKIAEANAAAEKAERTVSILLNANEDGNFAPRVAWLELLELLGVDNQTAAAAKLRDMVEVMNFLDEPDHGKLMERMRLARMEHSL